MELLRIQEGVAFLWVHGKSQPSLGFPPCWPWCLLEVPPHVDMCQGIDPLITCM